VINLKITNSELIILNLMPGVISCCLFGNHGQELETHAGEWEKMGNICKVKTVI
jgi:hypothetical protein